MAGTEGTQKFQAARFDGTVIQKLDDGTLVATDYLEPGDVQLADEQYLYRSGRLNAQGRVVVEDDAAEEEDDSSKKTAKKSASSSKK